MKICFKCGVKKPLVEFYAHPRMPDGHVNKCKDCNKLDVRQNRADKIDYYRAYDVVRSGNADRVQSRIEYSKSDRGKKTRKVASRNWDDRNKNKKAAHTILGNAVRDGKIKRQPCEKCGSIKVQAHHDDYTKPIEVRWLCIKHHAEHHRHERGNFLERDEQLTP